MLVDKRSKAMEMMDLSWRVTPASMANHLTRLRCTACAAPKDPDAVHTCWRWPSHLDQLSLQLTEVATGRCPRLLLHAPPRHGKSMLTSKWFPVWFFEQFPHKRVIFCSYEAQFAARWGRSVRNEITEYKHELSVRVSLDSKANDDWETTEGGGMKTAGVGGPIVGRGGDVMILDDPVKNWEEASSSTYRDRLWDWWDTTFYPRLEPRGSIVVAMTRWHSDDLHGRIMESAEANDWKVLNMAAIAGPNDDLGRKEGEALWPERYNREALDKVRRRSIYVYDSQYQQNPPDLYGGNVYNMFRDAAPPDGNVDDTIEIVDGHPLHLSIDFNINPGMHGVIGQHFEDADLITVRHIIHGPRMDTRKMMEEFRDWIEDTGGWRWPELIVFGDPSGRNRWAGTGKSCWDIVKEALEEGGVSYRLKVSSRTPAIADRVITLNSALMDGDGKPHYTIHPNCESLLEDLRRMKWDGDELDKRDRELSHASDAEGYRVIRIRPIRPLETTVGRVGTSSGRKY